MTQYVGLEPWQGGDDVVAVAMQRGYHELRAFYDVGPPEVDGEVLTLRFGGLEGGPTPDLFLSDLGIVVVTPAGR